jgi:hypothetical protein
MDRAEFDEHIGSENICANVQEAIARAREINVSTTAG